MVACTRNHLDLLSYILRTLGVSRLAVAGQRQDGRELTAHLDPLAIVLRGERDALHKAADQFAGLCRVVLPEGIYQAGHFVAV